MGCQELRVGCQKVVSGFEFSFHNASIKKINFSLTPFLITNLLKHSKIMILNRNRIICWSIMNFQKLPSFHRVLKYNIFLFLSVKKI